MSRIIIPHLHKLFVIFFLVISFYFIDSFIALFFYDDTNEQVPEGEPIGLDVDTDEGVELVLFSNIYWSPQYEELDNEND